MLHPAIPTHVVSTVFVQPDRAPLHRTIHLYVPFSNNKVSRAFIALIPVERIFFPDLHRIKLVLVCCSNGSTGWINVGKGEIYKALYQLKRFVRYSDTSSSAGASFVWKGRLRSTKSSQIW